MAQVLIGSSLAHVAGSSLAHVAGSSCWLKLLAHVARFHCRMSQVVYDESTCTSGSYADASLALLSPISSDPVIEDVASPLSRAAKRRVRLRRAILKASSTIDRSRLLLMKPATNPESRGFGSQGRDRGIDAAYGLHESNVAVILLAWSR